MTTWIRLAPLVFLPAFFCTAQTPGGAVRASANQTPLVCGGQANCTEVASFAATLTDFRASTVGRDRILIATVRFQNKTPQPLILGFVENAGVAVDDQGNRYVIRGDAGVRGIGIIGRNNLDPKFVLQPGESSDGRFELLFRHGREILGITHELDLTVREILPIPGNQFKLGREHAIRFSGLNGTTGVTSAQPGAATPPPSQISGNTTPAPAPLSNAAAVAPVDDACGGRPRCFSAGPFTAEVTNLAGSQASPGSHHVLRVSLRLRNVSSETLVLAYKGKTSLATDNYGNPYYWGRAGTYDTSAQGIGTDKGQSVDTSFVLRPGESRNTTFQLYRYSPPRNSPLGTGFTWDLVISQLEVFPNGQQVRSLRDYSLHFQDLTSTAAVPNVEGINESVKKLSDLFRKK